MQYKSKVPVAAWGEPARPGLALHLLPCAVGQSLLSPTPDFSAPAAKMMKQEVGYVALPLAFPLSHVPQQQLVAVAADEVQEQSSAVQRGAAALGRVVLESVSQDTEVM